MVRDDKNNDYKNKASLLEDYSGKKINKTITARTDEIETIKKQFNLVLEGQNAMTLISGPPGIGKTFLVEHVVNELFAKDISYTYSKFRQNNEKPLIVISEIIEQMLKHLLTLPFEKLNSIKSEIQKALGTDIEIIISVCPYAMKIFESNKNVNIEDYEKLKYRVKNALFRFIVVVSKYLFPMIICIDDLQWADKPSLETIELICKDSEMLNILLILTYRDNEKKYTSNIKNISKTLNNKEYKHIKLKELSYMDTKELLRLVFGENIENINYVARLIFGLTLGNPFYVKEIINMFIQENIISYDTKVNQWKISIDEINSIGLSDDLEQIIINKLNDVDKSLLELISCLDGIVDYKMLKSIENIEDKLLLSQLEKLCIYGFLVKIQNKDNISYGFVHDIILDIIYKNIESHKKLKIHNKISQELLEYFDKNPNENNRLLFASQLLRGDLKILKNKKTVRWIYELYYAGIQAKQSTAIEEALKIFECCDELLKEYNFNEKDDIEMKIKLELGECQFFCKRYKEAEGVFEKLKDKYKSVESLVAIKRKYMDLYRYRANHEKVLELGIEILNHLNYDFNINDFKEDLIEEKELLNSKKIERINNDPFIKDERIITILEILTKMAPSALLVEGKLYQYILIKVGLLSANHGKSVYAPIGYAAHSIILHNIWNEHKKGKKLELVTLELLKDVDDLYIKCIVYFLIGSFVDHLSNPMGKSIDYLEESVEAGFNGGEFLYSGYAITSIIRTKFIMGIPLKELTDYIDLQEKNSLLLGQDAVKSICDIFKNHICYLEKGGDIHLNEAVQLPINPVTLKNCVLEIQRLYLIDETEKAYEIVEKITEDIGSIKGHIVYMDMLFYCTLIRIDKHEFLASFERERNNEIIEKYFKELKYWIDVYKDDHYGRYLLIKAEYQKIFQKEKSIDKLLNEAIAFAENHNQLQVQAIGNIIASKYYCSYNKKLSKFYAKESASLFEEWGARYIANLIEKKYGLNSQSQIQEIDLKDKIITKKHGYKEKNRDIIYHLNKIENMDEKQGFIYILDFLVKNKKIDYGAIVFEKSNEMFIKYEKQNNDQVVSLNKAKNIKDISFISHKIIRYVLRTEEEIILDGKSKAGIFTKDIHRMKKDKIAIICIPIKYLDVLIGIIYLEQNCKNGFDENTSLLIKSLIPALISKMKIIKNINLHKLFNPQNTYSPLTDREEEVLQLVAEGLSNSAIGKKLYISLGTVKNHLSSIYSKLEVDSRIKAVIKAKEFNIIKT